MQHLNSVAALALQNRMNVSNLAVVFGPTIMRSPKGLSDDLRDQGSQCKFVSVLMDMSAQFFDNLRTLRSPHRTLSLSFDIVSSDSTHMDAASVPIMLPGMRQILGDSGSGGLPPLAGQLMLESTAIKVAGVDESLAVPMAESAQPRTCSVPGAAVIDEPTEKIPAVVEIAGLATVTVETVHPETPRAPSPTLKAIDTDESVEETAPTPTGKSSRVQLPVDFDLSALTGVANDLIAEIDADMRDAEDRDDVQSSGNDNNANADVKAGVHTGRSSVETPDYSRDIYANVCGNEGGDYTLVTSPKGFDCAVSPEGFADESPLASMSTAANVDVAAAAASPEGFELNEDTDIVEVAIADEEEDAADDRGACAECWADNVVGVYDEETESFYCARCWNVWVTDAATTSTIQLEDEAASGRVGELQYDEDGLPIEFVDSTTSDRPSVFFDDDGLPCDINVDEYEPDVPATSVPEPTAVSVTRPTTRPLTQRRQLTAVAEEQPTREHKKVARDVLNTRKVSDPVSKSGKVIETCRDGVLWREVGTSWKKRYVAVHDSILKIHKSAKASSAVTEQFNITSHTRVGFESGNRSFLLSFPEKGYTLRLKANKTKDASGWVRIVKNNCRIAHSTA